MEKDKLFAFVLMPFDEKYDDIYNLAIKEVASNLDIRAERVDEQRFKEDILDRIYRQIEASDIIIADMSGQNPNVFYEVGYAHARDKLCVLLARDVNDIPFDLKHRRHVIYSPDALTSLREKLNAELLWAKGEIEKINESRIKTQVKSIYGYLDNSDYTSVAEIDIIIDLHNESTESSPEIDAIYFYTTKGWDIYQDKKRCSSTVSDIPPFEQRHYIQPTTRRLSPGMWAQLKLHATKQIASKYKGEEIPDTYRVAGKSILRFATTAGPFDYPIFIETTLDDLPF